MKPIEYKELFERELFESCIPFWLAHGVDGVNGGLYSCLDREGNIYSTDKSVWMQGRCAYMFSKLSNTFGARKEWLDLAKSCLDFLEEHCIDSDGRMYFTVTKEGKPLRKRRYMFSETFYIIANAEYYKATGDETALKRARKYYDFVCAMYDDPNTDPYKITPKSVPGVRDTKALAVPMILLNVTAVMFDADKERYDLYDKRARSLVEDVKSFRYEDTGFMLESVGLNGEYYGDVSSARVVNPGHSIELSWFLMDEAEREGDDELFAYAERIFNTAIDFGWDKLWWPHNEAVIASLKLYKKTGNPKYWEYFERVADYAFKHFSDFKYGEWYGYLRRDGKPTEPPCKGHTYKGPFHVLRMLTQGIGILTELSAENA